eukprot:scaffold4547_cov103-Cylindrotheca_fusiformis.AAC.6
METHSRVSSDVLVAGGTSKPGNVDHAFSSEVVMSLQRQVLSSLVIHRRFPDARVQLFRKNAILRALPAEGGIDEKGPTRRLRSRRGDWNDEGRQM